MGRGGANRSDQSTSRSSEVTAWLFGKENNFYFLHFGDYHLSQTQPQVLLQEGPNATVYLQWTASFRQSGQSPTPRRGSLKSRGVPDGAGGNPKPGPAGGSRDGQQGAKNRRAWPHARCDHNWWPQPFTRKSAFQLANAVHIQWPPAFPASATPMPVVCTWPAE